MVSILFVQKKSVYKDLGYECWDEERNALNFPGGHSVVCHPPCRLWGGMRNLSTVPEEDREAEKELALFAIRTIHKWGGGVRASSYQFVVETRLYTQTGGFTRQSWWLYN